MNDIITLSIYYMHVTRFLITLAYLLHIMRFTVILYFSPFVLS